MAPDAWVHVKVKVALVAHVAPKKYSGMDGMGCVHTSSPTWSHHALAPARPKPQPHSPTGGIASGRGFAVASRCRR